MDGISNEKLAKLWSRSLTSTEIAIFHMMRTVLILTLAIQTKGENSDQLWNQSRQEIIKLLKSIAEMQKILLQKLDIYLHFLHPDEREEIMQIMNIEENQTAMVEMQFYTSSISLRCSNI
jgi:hypothetical protein